jgi:MFS family permease
LNGKNQNMNTTNINAPKLFQASCIALITTAMTFAIRGGLMETWGNEFSLTAEQIGWVNGTAFWGFTLAMVFGGPLCDILGMRNLLRYAFIGHILGIGLTIMAEGYLSLFIATLVIGISNGLVEAACNPLVTSLYPNEKIKYLNRFHIWFPGGIVIGGLVSYFLLDQFHIPWRFLMATLIIPNLIYGFLAFNSAFPVSERVSSGTSSSEMYKSLLNPLFIVMVACMMLTAATELGTNQWITALLANVGVPSILLLVFINGIMALGRGFAGELAHKLAPTGILLFSAIFSTLGLVLLSYSQGYLAFFSAAVFAVGVCYFWPTMLGFVSEYLPKTGPMGLSIMGGAGMLSVSFILPMMGKRFDNNLTGLIPENYILETLKNAAKNTKEATLWTQINLEAGSQTLLSVAVLPLFLVFVFACIFIFMRNKTTTNDN